jgi:type VI secretion system secreted protein Hcp
MPFAIFLKIDGVPGESQDAKHKDEIDVLAWSWGLNRTVSEGKVNIEGRTGSEG